MRARIKLKCDSTINWAQENPVLLDGEPGVEITNENKVLLKIGNGVTAWNELAYQTGDMEAITRTLETYGQDIFQNTQDISALDTAVNGEEGIVAQIGDIDLELESLSEQINSITYYNHAIRIQCNEKYDIYFSVISKQSLPLALSQMINVEESKSVTGVLFDSGDVYNAVALTRDLSDVYTFTGYGLSGNLTSILDISDPECIITDTINIIE